MSHIPKCFNTVLEHCLEGNSSSNKGEKYLLNSGDYIWLKWNISPWYLPNGTVGGVHVILYNVTSIKNQEELLIEAQSLSRIGGWELNFQNNNISWTQTINIIQELPLEYTPKSMEEFFLHFKLGKYRSHMKQLTERAKNKGIPWEAEVKSITAKGNTLWLKTKGQPQIVDGKCVRIFGYHQDITHRKIEELEYRKLADRAQKAIKASNVGVWQYFIEDNHIIWDEMCYQIHHVDSSKFPSPYEAWTHVVHPEDINHVLKQGYILSRGEGTASIEYRILLKDGSIRYLEATATFSAKNEKLNHQAAIGIIKDVTQHKESLKKIKAFSEITKEQNQSLTNFAHVVSHDLRSHATNLSMVTSFLLEEQDEKEKSKLIAMLKQATESLNTTVYNLNEVVNSSYNVSEKLISVPLKPVIDTVVNNISVLFIEKNAKTIINVSPTTKVLAVPAYLDSIMLNLFTNSLKYAAAERAPILEISAQKKESFIEVTFKDNGKGIDLEKFGRKIFGMHKTFHRNKDARGVGLYIIKNQIDAMGGCISVESEVNVGTTFTLKFKI